MDAVVQGGIKKYEEAFFSEEYLRMNPHDSDNILYLKRIIVDQVGQGSHGFLGLTKIYISLISW